MDDLTFKSTLNNIINPENSTIKAVSNFKQSSHKDDIRQFYHNIESIISIFPVFLVIAGTLGNLVALYVLTRKKLRTQSTMIYFASLTVMDTLSLYQWLVFLLIYLNCSKILGRPCASAQDPYFFSGLHKNHSKKYFRQKIIKFR